MFLKNSTSNFTAQHLAAFEEIATVSEQFLQHKSAAKNQQQMPDPQVYLQCTQNLFKLFEEIENDLLSTPQQFLLFAYDQAQKHVNYEKVNDSEHDGQLVKALQTQKTALKLLQSQSLPSMSYQDLDSLVKVEEFQAQLLGGILEMEKVMLWSTSNGQERGQMLGRVIEGLQDGMIEFYCQLVSQYWLENSCFESRLQILIQSELSTPDQPNQATIKLLVAFVEKLDLILQTQTSDQPSDQENSEQIQIAANIGSQQQYELIIENQTVYKTLQLIKNSNLLQISRLMMRKFRSIAEWNKGKLAVTRCLAQCLKIHDTKLCPGKNQMMLKVAQVSEIEDAIADIRQFCSFENLVSLLQSILQSKDQIKEDENKHMLATYELISQIINSSYSAYIFDNQSNTNLLLDGIIEVIDSQRVPFEKVCRLFPKLNQKLYSVSSLNQQENLPDDRIQCYQKWLIRLSELSENAVSRFDQISVVTFNNILASWIPILDLFQRSQSLDQALKYQDIVQFLTEKVSCSFIDRLLASQSDEGVNEDSAIGEGFLNDDTFAEHLESANSKSIKEILRVPMMLAAMGGQNQLLTEFMVSKIQILSTEIAGQQLSFAGLGGRCQKVCWLLHSMLIFFRETVSRLEVDGVEIFLPIVEQRLICASQLAAQILRLEEAVFPGIQQAMMAEAMSSASQEEKQSLVFQVKYAITKCMLTLSKSLLSQKIKQRVQERVADEVATLASYQSRHQILTNLISFCLLQIEFLKEAKKHTGSANCQNHIQSILFEQTLKFLVQLTITKPYVNKESKTMQIKQYFMLDFDTLVQLKDYLKEQIQQNKNQRVIDFKHQRQVVVSLTILMCEFDTLSDSGEVLADVHSAIEQNFVEISQARQSNQMNTSQFIYLFRGVLNNMRGLFEGVYRSRQFMWLLTEKFLATENAIIKDFIADTICSKMILMEDDNSVQIEDKMALSKSILKMMREITFDRDTRMQFDASLSASLAFMQVTIQITFSCLGILKAVDIHSGGKGLQEQVFSILKKALKVALQIGKNQSMGRKQMESYPELKETFQTQLASSLEGLKLLVEPTSLMKELDQKSQKLVFEFIHFLVDRHFGMILHLSREAGNASYFSYTLSIISEGLHSSQSTALLSSLDCIDFVHNYAIKGSKYFRSAIKELLLLPETVLQFKKIVKLNLRAFLRREETNKGKKIECTVKIINMYRVHIDMHLQPGECSFYESCAQEVANEYQAHGSSGPSSSSLSSGSPGGGPLNEIAINGQAPQQPQQQSQIHYQRLIQIVQNVNWQSWKPPQIVAAFRTNLEAALKQ